MLMQSLQFIYTQSKKWFGFFLFIICGFAIYKEAIANQNWVQYGGDLKQRFSQITVMHWLVLLGLMACNFFIESIKWMQLVKQNNTISMAKSVQSVFVGQAFAFFTPNRIGDYVGRTLFLDKGNKARGMAQMAWTSYAQLLVTIVIGSVAFFWNHPFFPWLKWVSPFLAIASIFVFFHKMQFNGWLSVLNKIQIPTHSKSRLLMLSLLRYSFFIVQYVWAAKIIGMDIVFWELASSIAVLFLCLSILPTISITELVVRGQLLLLILAPYCADKLLIISLSSLIWLVNFLLPAIIGAFLLLGFRLKQ